MSLHPHYVCESCGLKLSDPYQKCVGCGHKKVEINPLTLSGLNIPKIKEGVKIQISLHQDGSRLSDVMEFDTVQELIDWIREENKKL